MKENDLTNDFISDFQKKFVKALKDFVKRDKEKCMKSSSKILFEESKNQVCKK